MKSCYFKIYILGTRFQKKVLSSSFETKAVGGLERMQARELQGLGCEWELSFALHRLQNLQEALWTLGKSQWHVLLGRSCGMHCALKRGQCPGKAVLCYPGPPGILGFHYPLLSIGLESGPPVSGCLHSILCGSQHSWALNKYSGRGCCACANRPNGPQTSSGPLQCLASFEKSTPSISGLGTFL